MVNLLTILLARLATGPTGAALAWDPHNGTLSTECSRLPAGRFAVDAMSGVCIAELAAWVVTHNLDTSDYINRKFSGRHLPSLRATGKFQN